MRGSRRIVGGRLWRCVGWSLIFISLAGLWPLLRADDATPATNAPDAAPAPPGSPIRPFLSTNPASSTFLHTHPELAEPVPSDQSGLSLRPDPGAANAPPQVVPPAASTLDAAGPHDNVAPGFDTSPAITPIDQAEDLAAHLLVVYNSADPDSQGLAQYYASRRNIPAERVLAITAPITEEITRAQYDDTIRSPIVSYLCQKDWMVREPQRVQVGSRFFDLLVATRNDIWAIVLMRGVPLKIAPDPSNEDSMEYQPVLQTNAAAVDNELALLPIFGLPEGGFVPNLFFDDQVSGIKHVSPELAKNMVLVTRLDGPKVSDVRRMIDDSVNAEKNRLAGLAVIDTRGLTDVKNGYTSGDIWLRSARDMLVNDGWVVKFDDKPEVLPTTDPCNHVALYLGWYSQTAEGPWVTAPDRFVPGAIAYHLHSFSASTVRSETNNWVGPLIAHGADATMGMVYEPYLPFTPHEDIFTRRLLQGDYFAEAAYASERALSWMLTVVGDPLYRPFRQPLDSALAQAAVPHTAHDDWLLLQKAQREIKAGRMTNTTSNLQRLLHDAGPIAEEGVGDMLEKRNDPSAGAAAESAYKKAFTGVSAPVDRIRIGLKLVQHYSSHSQSARAEVELVDLREEYPEDAKTFGISYALLPTSVSPASPSANRETPKSTPTQLPQLPSLPKPTPVAQ